MERNLMYERKMCPMCGAVGKDLREVEDRRPSRRMYRISTGTFMYPKKNYCKKCGYEW